jgi:hypothetical protein
LAGKITASTSALTAGAYKVEELFSTTNPKQLHCLNEFKNRNLDYNTSSGKPFLANYYFEDLALNINIRICIRIPFSAFEFVLLVFDFRIEHRFELVAIVRKVVASKLISNRSASNMIYIYIYIHSKSISFRAGACAERFGFAMKILYFLKND